MHESGNGDAGGDGRRVVVRDRACEDRVAPERGGRTREVRDDHGSDAHDGAVAGGALRGLVPGSALLVAAQEGAHGAADAVDAAAVGEGRGEAVGDDAAVVEDVLERPERELRVVGGESDAAVVGLAVREVVADLAVLGAALVRETALGGVAEGVADREREERAGDAVDVGWSCVCGRIAESGEEVERRLDVAARDAGREVPHAFRSSQCLTRARARHRPKPGPGAMTRGVFAPVA